MNEELSVQEKRTLELVKFDKIAADIAILEEKYMAIKVEGPDDEEGCAMARKARLDVKSRRVSFVKDGEEMRADAVRFQRLVTGKVNPIEDRCKKIEAYLQGQEDIIANEKARIKAEADAKEAARIQARVDTICAFGATFNGQMYAAFGLQIPAALVKACTDEEFASFVAQVQEKKDAEDARLKAEEEARKAEAERVAKVAAEQETERTRLARIAAEQEAEARRQAAEQKRLDDAKQKAIDDARHAEEMEKVKKAAIEQARIDVEAKIKRQVEEKAAADLAAKIAAEKKAARAPDKVKLIIFTETILEVPVPQMKTPEGEAVLVSICGSLGAWIKTMNEKIEEAL